MFKKVSKYKNQSKLDLKLILITSLGVCNISKISVEENSNY